MMMPPQQLVQSSWNMVKFILWVYSLLLWSNGETITPVNGNVSYFAVKNIRISLDFEELQIFQVIDSAIYNSNTFQEENKLI